MKPAGGDMTKLTKKRIDIIKQVMDNHGIEFGNNIFISLWDLAHNINNTWKAEHFVNKNRFETEYSPKFALRSYQLPFLFNGIANAANKCSYVNLRKSYTNGTEYLIKHRAV